MVTRIDNYTEFTRSVVEPDFNTFMDCRDDLRKAWHCAGSLFHLADWVYAAKKSVIDIKYQYKDDNGRKQSVSNSIEFANSLGQAHPNFQLIRGIANSSKHCYLKPVPAGRDNPPGMPTHAANTYVSGSAFQPGAFQSSSFQTGEVKLQSSNGDIEFAILAKSVLEMWNELFRNEGW
jgi:hypothetical protein